MSKHWPPPWKPGDLVWNLYAFKSNPCVVTKVFDRPGQTAPSERKDAVNPHYELYWLVEVIGSDGTVRTCDTRDLEWLQKRSRNL